jgi:hypothetical protein
MNTVSFPSEFREPECNTLCLTRLHRWKRIRKFKICGQHAVTVVDSDRSSGVDSVDSVDSGVDSPEQRRQW